MHMEFLIDFLDVGVHGSVGNIELVSDFLFDQTFGKEREDLHLPLAEWEGVGHGLIRYIAHDQFRHTGIQRGASTHDGMDALDNLIQAGTFQQIPGGSM